MRPPPCVRRVTVHAASGIAYGRAPLRGVVVMLVALLCGTGATARAASSDRAIKACLLARMQPAPQLVIYGSSRAAKLEPSYLEALLGEGAFNASVSSGTPEDVWAFAHFAHDQAGSASVRALWLLDLESLRPRPFDTSLLHVPTLARYFTTAGSAVGPAPAASHGPAARACTFSTSGSTHYTPDGFRARDFHAAAAARGFTIDQALQPSITRYTRIYASGFPRISSERAAWVADTIRAFNSWGCRPVIVLTPAHPAWLRALGPRGWKVRHAEVLSLLRKLPLHFTLLDASSISVFGGRRSAFYDGVHMRVENTRLLADWIARRAAHDLTVP